MKAMISDIKRFAVHDGDGIRTTVFLKGCPLKCVWCHNPESIDFKPQLGFYEHKCTLCEECVSACKNKAHVIQNGVHILDREKCTACGKCAEDCFNDTLTLYGKEMTVDEILSVILEDKDFYETSGGGVTLSGGECLMQPEFCSLLLQKVKENGINTAVDTCGFVSKESLDKVIPFTDVFLYDFKAFDRDVHIKCTGQSNKTIIENLKYLDSLNKKIEIRIPFVPKFNDDQIEKIGKFLSTLKNVTKVRILPYHNYAGSKYLSLGISNTLPKTVPTKADIDNAVSLLKKMNLTVL